MIRNNKKIAVLLWLYHTDLCEEFYELLKPCSDLIDVHLSLCEDNDNAIALKTLNKLNSIKSISYYPNCGADIYSFINEINKIDSDSSPYFIKIHSKKSKWGVNGICNWRAILLDSLIGDRETLISNVQHISTNDYGMCGCKPMVYDESLSERKLHQDKIRKLKYIVGNNDFDSQLFFGGTMFLGQTRLYQKYLTKDTVKQICGLLVSESGKINEYRGGTYSHAMERLLGYIGCSVGIGYCEPETIRIKVYDPKLLETHDFLSLRIMYNKEVYCIEQPSIYGSVTGEVKDTLNIRWHNTNVLATYTKTGNNIYSNSRHLNGGV